MLHRILRYTRIYGPLAAGRHVVDRIRDTLCPPVRQVYCARLAELSSSPDPAVPALEVRSFDSLDGIPPAITEDLFSKGTIDDRKPVSREMVSDFLRWLFSRGAIFWVGREDGQFVGYLWSLRGSPDTPRYHFFPLGTDDAVFLAHEIFPPYRGRGLNRQMTQRVLGEMKARGVERVFVDVLLTNERSLQSFAKTSFRPVGQAHMKDFKKGQVVVWRKRRASVPPDTPTRI
jgi:ribosomal protein S18 acetylase RimI-like enzyme